MYREEFGKLFWIALPLSLAQVAQNTTSLVDTLMVGRLGEDSLAGIAIGATMFHFVSLTIAGIIYAVSPMVSQAVGANETNKIGQAVRQGFWIGAMGFLPCLLIYWNADPILRLLGQEEKVVHLSSDYLRAISFGMLPAMWIFVLRGFLEGISDTRPILVIALIAVGLNVFLNDALMFGKYGLPELGLVGTGVASSIMYWCVFLMLLGYVWTKHKRYQLFERIHQVDWKMIRELLSIGLPISMTIFFEFSMFAACLFGMGIIGSQQLAAHQIAIQTASITFMIPLGIGLATSVRVGNFAGQRDWQRAKIAGQVGMIAAAIVMSVMAVLFWLFPRTIVSFYLDVTDSTNHAVIEIAVSFLWIAALFQIVDGVQVAASNSLRGLKQTKAAMFWTMFAYWGVGIPACAFLGFRLTRLGGWGLEWGGRGLWYGLTLGLAAAAISLALRFHAEFVADEKSE